MSTAVDLDLLRQWVGRTQTFTQRLDPFPAQALAALLDLEQVPAAGDALPVPWHWMYFLEAPRHSETGPDGHPKRGGFLPPVPLPRRMWAGGRFDVQTPLRLGDEASRTSTVRSVELKSGRQGPLVFVTVEHRLDQHGRTCLVERQDLVYREAPTAPAPLPPGEPAPAARAWHRQVATGPVLLFRFSALTYNGHRIHYDRDYAVNEEFYPGLVVHGPLQALLLLDLVRRERPQDELRSFAFRAVRPLISPDTLGLAGEPGPEGAALWSFGPDGAVCMHAEATWVAAPRGEDPRQRISS